MLHKGENDYHALVHVKKTFPQNLKPKNLCQQLLSQLRYVQTLRQQKENFDRDVARLDQKIKRMEQEVKQRKK